MTAPLIAPLVPPYVRPGNREHGRTATARRLPVVTVPVVPAVPDDVVYGWRGAVRLIPGTRAGRRQEAPATFTGLLEQFTVGLA